MSRAQLTSTDQQNSGGPVSPYVAGKNFAANGNFDIWQRGTSFTSTGYYADRWTDGNINSTMTASQQTSGAPNNSRYYLRHTATGSSSYKNLYQVIETANVIPLQGKTVTLSVKLRRNSTMSSAISVDLQKSATVDDASVGGSFSDIAALSVSNATIPTGTTSSDWYTAKLTTTIPNDGTANTLLINISYVSAVTTGSITEFAQVQLEIGSVATPFSRAGGTVQGAVSYTHLTLPTNREV